MTDWNSPLVLARNAASLAHLTDAFMGVVALEWLISLDFDISLLIRKRKFRWQLIPYLWGRYAMVTSMIAYCIILDSNTQLNCRAAFRAACFLGSTTLSAASFTLSLRTMAVWNQDKRVVVPLVMLALGHLGIALRSIVSIDMTWVTGSGCVSTRFENHIYILFFGYTMVLDLTILLLTGYKLWSFEKHGGSNGIVKFLFKDGLVYFLVAFLTNAVALVFAIVNLNPIMSLIPEGPAIVLSAIASGRLVRRLTIYSEKTAGRIPATLPVTVTAGTNLHTSDFGLPASQKVTFADSKFP